MKFLNNTRNTLTRLSAAITVLFLLICTVFGNTVSVAAASDIRTIKVGFFAFPGYHEIDDDSVRRGYGIDFLLLLQRYTDLNYEYVGYDKSWEDMLQMLRDGEIDMVTSARKTPEREQEFDFSEPIGSASVHLNVLADDDRYTPSDFASFDGMRIGLLAGSSRNADVSDFAHQNRFRYKTTIYQTADELVSAWITTKLMRSPQAPSARSPEKKQSQNLPRTISMPLSAKAIQIFCERSITASRK